MPHVSESIRKMRSSIEIDLQLLACELDISVGDLYYISTETWGTDSMGAERFERWVENVRLGLVEGVVEVSSFDDNTEIYLWDGDRGVFIIHNNLGFSYLLFDKSIRAEVENIFLSPNTY